VAAAVEEIGSSGVDDGGGDWRGLREFCDEKLNATGRATIYRFETISSGSLLEPLLIVLKSGPKRFWFKTAANGGIISNGSKLEPHLSATIHVLNRC
jgi:hypothetical protein